MAEEKSLLLLIGELKGKLDLVVTSMNNLASSFENLEKGRLSRAEITIAEMKVEMGQVESKANKSAQTKAMWVALIASAVMSVTGTLMLHYLFRMWG